MFSFKKKKKSLSKNKLFYLRCKHITRSFLLLSNTFLFRVYTWVVTCIQVCKFGILINARSEAVLNINFTRLISDNNKWPWKTLKTGMLWYKKFSTFFFKAASNCKFGVKLLYAIFLKYIQDLPLTRLSYHVLVWRKMRLCSRMLGL